MNFRTTVILLVLLLGVVGYLYFTAGNAAPPEQRTINAQKLLDINSTDVSKVVLRPKDGKDIVLERSTLTNPTPTIEQAKSDWKLTSPITQYADTAKVTDLIDGVVGATSTSETALNSTNSAEFGLDDPQFTIEFQAGTKTVKVIIGRVEKAANELYVRVEGKDVAEVVAADLLDKIDTTAEKLRLAKLITVDSSTANWVDVRRPSDPLTLEKAGGQWQLAATRPSNPDQPATMPTEDTAVSEMISAIGGATAVEFGDEASDGNLLIGKPRATVVISDKKQSTQPAEKETIEFGQSDLQAKNVWVRVTPPGELATITKQTMDSILKSSVDLRDHNVVQVASSAVQSIRVVKTTPATTQPLPMPSKFISQEMTRRPKLKVVEGPPVPVTQPTTEPTTMASTQPGTQPTTMASTQPVIPPPPSTEWQITSTKIPGDADDSKVDAAVASFNPLKVDKFLWGRPTTRPSEPGQTTYLVTLTTDKGEEINVMISDPGEGAADKPWGATSDAVFEVPRAVITALNVDFAKGQ